jgi:hypothetical protein
MKTLIYQNYDIENWNIKVRHDIRKIKVQTICWQSWEAATKNPVEALRYE